jgi:phosphomannomutase
MKKVELKLKNEPDKEIIIDDVLGNPINLGVNPRLVFGGEESGGMIMGTEELIKSEHGRLAVAMREKSATEAIVVASALIAKLRDKSLSQYLADVFEENNIIGRFDTRVDIAYYNESEPDINKLKLDKIAGEEKRTLNDIFYLSMAIALKKGEITLEGIQNILNDKFKNDNLTFDNLKSVKFVGDGTYLEFSDKYIEIRPSGTDAKTKAYGGGLNKDDIQKYATILGNYSGERTSLHKQLISEELYQNCKDLAMEYYLSFVEKDANNEPFNIPQYDF